MPILSELRCTETGATYLEKWHSRKEGRTCMLLVPSTPMAIAQYLSGGTSLLKLLTEPNDDAGFLVELQSNRPRYRTTRFIPRITRITNVVVSQLDNLPDADVMHDETLRGANFYTYQSEGLAKGDS